MGQANVKRWTDSIRPLLMDGDPLGVEACATHRQRWSKHRRRTKSSSADQQSMRIDAEAPESDPFLPRYTELAEFFRRAQAESRKGAEQGRQLLRNRLG